jgi:hypothetical protein
MEIDFLLQQVLQAYAPRKDKRGLFLEIHKWSKRRVLHDETAVVLERHKLARLFRNEDHAVSFAFLGTLCEYFIAECGVPERVLPQKLFGAKERQLLDLIGKSSRLQFFVGMRSSKEWGANPYVMAPDAALQNEFTRLITRYLAMTGRTLLEAIDTILVDAPPRNVRPSTTSTQWIGIKQRAAEYFREFLAAKDLHGGHRFHQGERRRRTSHGVHFWR